MRAMDLITGLLALLLDYFGLDRCDCDAAGTCLHCVSSRALDEAEKELPAAYAAANHLSGPAVHRRFQEPIASPSGVKGGEAPPDRLFVAKAHSDGRDASDHCDFAMIQISAELAQVLLAYGDAVDSIAAAMKARFSIASYSHELKIFPPAYVVFLGRTGPVDDLPPDDPLCAAIDAAMKGDLVSLLPAGFAPPRYNLGEVVESTDTDHCLVSRDGVRFCAYAGDTRVFTTEVGWDFIEAVLTGKEAGDHSAE